jgi:murein DD-endopeptidase MepM/ murein hydrolase activator NlpD
MTGYEWPVPSTDWVSCDWRCHKDRNPPSGEPGTDIGCSYGSLIVAPESGTVTYVKWDNSGGMGRTVQVLMIDGKETRPMHMSEIWVTSGQWVSRGEGLGLSGGSGFGDDWYYGPHNHQTLWDGPAWSGPTIDFELYVGEPTPPPEDDMTPEQARLLGEIHQAIYTTLSQPGGWKGINETLGEVWVAGGEVHQAVFIRASDGDGAWDGLDQKAIDTLAKVTALRTDPPPTTLSAEQIQAIADAVVDALPDVPGGGASPAEVHQIVTDALGALVLRASL